MAKDNQQAHSEQITSEKNKNKNTVTYENEQTSILLSHIIWVTTAS